jgi:hypothetical protein
MRTVLIAVCLTGCGAAGTGQPLSKADTDIGGKGGADVRSAGGANVFNPYVHERLPSMRRQSAENEQMLRQMGSDAQRIEGEAAHRPHWRQELYPVVFGDPKSPHEILVLLDFAQARSEKVWQAVVEASRSLTASRVKIAVFANSGETYGTDLMGLAIWLAYSRPGQAVPYLSHVLSRWNAIKAEQKRVRGRAALFTNEYDATVNPSDYPLHYHYLATLRPPVPQSEEPVVARYCYDAGNVNMYQAVQIGSYYKVGSLPAVIVDGRVLSSVSAGSILDALK